MKRIIFLSLSWCFCYSSFAQKTGSITGFVVDKASQQILAGASVKLDGVAMAAVADDIEVGLIVKDANGNLLADGDTVTLIKDLKVKGSSTTLKVGTKIKGIRLVSGDHEVDCKTEAGNMLLKACFLKKA